MNGDPYGNRAHTHVYTKTRTIRAADDVDVRAEIPWSTGERSVFSRLPEITCRHRVFAEAVLFRRRLFLRSRSEANVKNGLDSFCWGAAKVSGMCGGDTPCLGVKPRVKCQYVENTTPIEREP